jgi:hypothetical protein
MGHTVKGLWLPVAIWITKSWLVKGTVSRDILLPVFFYHVSSSPKPPKITLGSKNLENSRRPQVKVHHRGINDTGNKFANGVNDTGGK